MMHPNLLPHIHPQIWGVSPMTGTPLISLKGVDPIILGKYTYFYVQQSPHNNYEGQAS